MFRINSLYYVIFFAVLLAACSSPAKETWKKELGDKVSIDSNIAFVKKKALETVKTGFNAGDGYGEVWIRDYNTFIELSGKVYDKQTLKENLLVFFRMQGEDGNIIDGFIPREKASKTEGGYDYIFSDLEPRYAGHKNTVETDQESSLIQAVYKYLKITGDKEFLNEIVDGKTIASRLELSLLFLINHRLNDKYGLIWGATTADWGDVQPEHDWGVFLTDDTHYSIDIYDNAMFLIAIDNFIALVPDHSLRWKPISDSLRANCRKYLWDPENNKFIPHIYLNGSPFPEGFNENEIYYHGGTAVAIEADLLTPEEIQLSLDRMISNVKASGAGSIGLTMYPPYPEGYFKNKGMYPYGYQNGGDWTWFGGRMIQQLIRNGMLIEAYEQLTPMLKRVKENNGFYEWYTVDNKPEGSGTFRGEAGVLYKAIVMLEESAGIASEH
jgi:glycogen debranching enzyme